MALQQNLINTFQMDQFLSFQMLMTPGEILAPWMLLLDKESHWSNIRRVIKKMLQTTDPYTTILKNPLQETLRFYNR